MGNDQYAVLYSGEYYYDRNTSTHLWSFGGIDAEDRYDLWQSRQNNYYLTKTTRYYDGDYERHYDGEDSVYSTDDDRIYEFLRTNSAPLELVKELADVTDRQLLEG